MLACLIAAAAAAGPWTALQPGLELGTFAGPKAPHGDGRIRVLRVDPERFDLRLMSAGAKGQGSRASAKEWARRAGGVAAINPSMFQRDGRAVSLFRTPEHVSNGRLTRDKSVLVFEPKEPGLPRVRLLDRECDDVEKIAPRYASAVQSIRMFSCKGKNVWAPQPRRWSAAAVGQDGAGRLLLIHVRSPYTMNELVTALAALPIDLQRLMYVEGGPEAQLYVKAPGGEQELIGSYETGFHELDDNAGAWPLPNALVVVPRKGAP
jgi:hypothetical protein